MSAVVAIEPLDMSTCTDTLHVHNHTSQEFSVHAMSNVNYIEVKSKSKLYISVKCHVVLLSSIDARSDWQSMQ